MNPLATIPHGRPVVLHIANAAGVVVISAEVVKSNTGCAVVDAGVDLKRLGEPRLRPVGWSEIAPMPDLRPGEFICDHCLRRHQFGPVTVGAF